LGAEKPMVRALYARCYPTPAPKKLGFSGAWWPDDVSFAHLFHDVTNTPQTVLPTPVMQSLFASPDALHKELLWRALLLLELYRVLPLSLSQVS
jgi:hypothetical protein